MKRVSLICLALLVSATVHAGDGRILTPRNGELIPDQYIVVFNKDVRGFSAVSGLASELASRHGSFVSRHYQHALNGSVMRMSERAAKAMALDPRVRYIEQDAIFHIKPDQANPTWGIDRVDERELPLDNNYHWDFDGTGVNIYIIDTGIRTTHVDFGGRASWGQTCIGPSTDDHGHGTHVAGTAASGTYGVAKNANVIAVKVCDASGSCPNSAITCGIDFVTAQKNASPSIPMVANMSLGGGFSQASNDAVNASANAGVFYAVAAGNENGVDACTRSPASAANAYTVGSTTSTDARSSFSNIGTCVNLFAPGSSITSTWNSSNTATAVLSGTSMATPHVAGAAALVLHENSALSPFGVGDELTSRATAGVISNAGAGSPNLLLYTLADTTPPPPPPPPAPSCPSDALDLGSFAYTGAAGQNVSNNFTIEDGGNGIRLQDNTWVRTTSTFSVSANTQLEFYFRSGSQGEIHAIGFDEDDTLNDDPRYFMFWGTQNWTGTGRIDAGQTYSGSGDWEQFTIDVGANYTGTMFLAFVNDNDAGSGNEGEFRCVRVFDDGAPPPPPPPPPPTGECAVDDDFESGATGWFNDGASTCSTGDYVLGNPTQQSSAGVITQVGGSRSGVNSIFTATNTSAGVNDVDNGNCILGSPTWAVNEDSTLSVWYFHGQRDTNDDPGDDFFVIEYSTNGGSTWSTLVSNGDSRLNAAWTNATTTIPAGSNAALRVQCSDGAGPGDLVECGIDDLSICPQ